MEPHASLAVPQEGGDMLILATTQHPDKTQVAAMFYFLLMVMFVRLELPKYLV